VQRGLYKKDEGADKILLLLNLSITTHAVIGQFSTPYSIVQLPLKCEAQNVFWVLCAWPKGSVTYCVHLSLCPKALLTSSMQFWLLKSQNNVFSCTRQYDIFKEKERKENLKEKETNLNLCCGKPNNYTMNIQYHAVYCTVQYLENIAPAIEQFEWLVLVTGIGPLN